MDAVFGVYPLGFCPFKISLLAVSEIPAAIPRVATMGSSFPFVGLAYQLYKTISPSKPYPVDMPMQHPERMEIAEWCHGQLSDWVEVIASEDAIDSSNPAAPIIDGNRYSNR